MRGQRLAQCKVCRSRRTVEWALRRGRDEAAVSMMELRDARSTLEELEDEERYLSERLSVVRRFLRALRRRAAKPTVVH